MEREPRVIVNAERSRRPAHARCEAVDTVNEMIGRLAFNLVVVKDRRKKQTENFSLCVLIRGHVGPVS